MCLIATFDNCTQASSSVQLMDFILEKFQNTQPSYMRHEKIIMIINWLFSLFLGIIILALIAKYVQHWRYIQLALNIPTLATLLYIW